MSVLIDWGMVCPNCYRDDGLDIECKTNVRLYADGTDADDATQGGHTWDGDSPCSCSHCGHESDVDAFTLSHMDPVEVPQTALMNARNAILEAAEQRREDAKQAGNMEAETDREAGELYASLADFLSRLLKETEE